MFDLIILFIGLAFLPNLISGLIQSGFYALWIRAGDPKPLPGSKRYQDHRNFILSGILILYFFYKVFDADWQIAHEGNIYTILDVPLDINEKGLLSRIRKLSAQSHPDKLSSNTDPLVAEALRLQIQKAKELLTSPLHRFGYDRFGPDFTIPAEFKNLLDIVTSEFLVTTSSHAIAAAYFLVLQLTGFIRNATFWRYYALLVCYVVSVYFLTHKGRPYFLSNILDPVLKSIFNHPPFLQFQISNFLSLTVQPLAVVMSQIGAVYSNNTSTRPKDDVTLEQINKSDMLTRQVNLELLKLMSLELGPLGQDDQHMLALREASKQCLVAATVETDTLVQQAITEVERRHKVE